MAYYLPAAEQCVPGSSGTITVEDMEAWFAKEGSSVHEAFGVETYYSRDQSRFIPGSQPPVGKLKRLLVSSGPVQTPNQLATTHNDQLNQAHKDNLDLLNCSWDDVLRQLEAAKLEHLKSSKKVSRRADKFMAKASSYIQPLVEVVPEEYGIGVIKGGLVLLFATAQHKERNREKIIQAFEEIPEMIRTMNVACKLFGQDDDEDIAGIAKSFYDELFKDIPDLIQILNETGKGFSRAMNRLVGGLPETQAVDGVLERLKRKSTELGSTISRIEMKLQAEGYTKLQALQSTMEGLASKRDLDHSTQNNNRILMQSANALRKQLANDMRQVVRSEVQAIVKNYSAGDFAAEAKTIVLRMAQENTILRDYIATQKLQIEYSCSRQPSPRPIPVLSDLDLMQILDVDPQSWTDDLSSVLRQASRMNVDNKARARWLMKTRHFQNWLGAPHPALLLAAGALRLEKVSPMSVLTGTLAVSLLDLPNTVVLHFFCGKHLDADAEDNIIGPRGMLHCLIAQLVLAYTAPLPDLSGIDSSEFLRDCYNRTLPALCEVFRLLVEQIPTGVALFVLIDGVSWYEQAGWAEELDFIVGLLKQLVLPQQSTLFKVLLTSPNRTSRLHELVDPGSEYISLAPGNMDYTPLISPSLMESMYARS